MASPRWNMSRQNCINVSIYTLAFIFPLMFKKGRKEFFLESIIRKIPKYGISGVKYEKTEHHDQWEVRGGVSGRRLSSPRYSDHVPRPSTRGQRLSAPAPMSQFRGDHGGPGSDHDNAVGDKGATSKNESKFNFSEGRVFQLMGVFDTPCLALPILPIAMYWEYTICFHIRCE